ncbi:hypothetical protein [Candidatus Clostridium radicumherbarum]|uniref:Uncharacterized protein n=1 Tax=Candidatus Clostridium radicumherbarum TaxID=3381662 RepID=A0ABW8TUJ7_9CLOT
MENRINFEMDDYFKNLKEADKYKGKKKTDENRFPDPITNELDQYMKRLSEEQRLKAKKAKINKKEPSGIIYDFMKITNHTIEDITTSLHKSANKLVEDMTYSLHKSGNKLVEDAAYSLHSFKKPTENKIDVNKSLDFVKEKEPIKQEVKTIDMKKELDNAKKIDKELYKNLESIDRITGREMQHLNNTYQQYNDLLNMANECNLHLGYDQRISGIKVYEESKRSIETHQAELVSVIKGENKEQQVLKSSEKAMNYINNAEKKIEDLKSQNKLLDIRGNIERNQVIKDIKKEIETQKQVLKDNGINTKEDFYKLKDEVSKRESSVKRLIDSENARYKEELKEKKKEEKLSKQLEQKPEKQLETSVKEQQNTRTKEVQLER